MFYVDYVNIMDEIVHIIEKTPEAFVVGVKRSFWKWMLIKYMIMSVDQNAERSENVKTDDSSFESVDEF